jgi:uncharacterized membrane protein
MLQLILAALIWIVLHRGLAGTPLRDAVVRRTGELGFRGVFSVLSIAALVFLIHAWDSSPSDLLWFAPMWLRWLLVLAMLPALVLFVGSVTAPNPTMVAPGAPATSAPRGIIRVTRHPMLWSVVIWSVVHIVGSGDTAGIVLFATLLVTALTGMRSIDRKLARRDPANWQALSAATSILPFAAIAQGRNKFVPHEIGWLTLAIAIAAWIVLLVLHPWLFGVTPVRL